MPSCMLLVVCYMFRSKKTRFIFVILAASRDRARVCAYAEMFGHVAEYQQVTASLGSIPPQMSTPFQDNTYRQGLFSRYYCISVFNCSRTKSGAIINSRPHLLSRLLLRSYFFLQFEEFELYWGAVFFLRSVRTFS